MGLPVVCAYCGTTMTPGTAAGPVSHGICAPCLAFELAACDDDGQRLAGIRPPATGGDCRPVGIEPDPRD